MELFQLLFGEKEFRRISCVSDEETFLSLKSDLKCKSETFFSYLEIPVVHAEEEIKSFKRTAYLKTLFLRLQRMMFAPSISNCIFDADLLSLIFNHSTYT